MIASELTDSIQKPAPQCAKCGAPLAQVPKHPSRLVTGSGGATERQDFCPACAAEVRAGQYHSRWLALRPAPPAPPRRLTRRAQAERFRQEFYRLADHPAPSEEDQDLLYLLAHLLMKVGGFRWRETDPEAGVIRFEDLSTKQVCEVPIRNLEPERVGQAQDRLASLL